LAISDGKRLIQLIAQWRSCQSHTAGELKIRTLPGHPLNDKKEHSSLTVRLQAPYMVRSGGDMATKKQGKKPSSKAQVARRPKDDVSL
jgi:hypothetical protein